MLRSNYIDELLSLICIDHMDKTERSNWLGRQRSASCKKRKLDEADLFQEFETNTGELIAANDTVAEVAPFPSTSQANLITPTQLQVPDGSDKRWDEEMEPFENNRDRELYSDSDESGTESDVEGSSDEDSSKETTDLVNVSSNPQHNQFIEDFRACVKNMTREQTEQLLRILHPHHPYLPLSKKTLFKTSLGLSRLIVPFDEDSSKFVYLGIGRFLQRYVNVSLHKNKDIYLQFNADGLPLLAMKSTTAGRGALLSQM